MNATASATLIDPPAIPFDDQLDLEWYFGLGPCRFSRSTFGPMIERLASEGWASRPCPACESGIRWDYEPCVEQWTDSYGHRHRSVRWRAPDGSLHDTNECRRCRGTGREPIRHRHRWPVRTGYRRCAACHGVGEDADGETCAACGGNTYRTAQAAFQTARQPGQGQTLDEGAIQRMARISRRLDRVNGGFPPSAIVLGLLYSDDGLRWAARGKPLVAVYPATHAGSKLCHGRIHADAIRSRLEAALTSTSVPVRNLLVQALAEATELQRRTIEAWHGTTTRQTHAARPIALRRNHPI